MGTLWSVAEIDFNRCVDGSSAVPFVIPEQVSGLGSRPTIASRSGPLPEVGVAPVGLIRL
jgi:hypothetical protein